MGWGAVQTAPNDAAYDVLDITSVTLLDCYHAAACLADAPAAPAPAPASSTLPAAGQQRAEGLAGAAPAHQPHHGIHLHPQQLHGHHRPQHRGPVSEQRRRMEAGINRNSRLWQVLNAEDPLAHSLGASPFDDERSGPAAHAGGPVLQVVPARARDGSIVLAATSECDCWSMHLLHGLAVESAGQLRCWLQL